MKKPKNQTTSTGNRIYETLDEMLEDRDQEIPTFDFDDEDEDRSDEG